jgi:hypothetical protein
MTLNGQAKLAFEAPWSGSKPTTTLVEEPSKAANMTLNGTATLFLQGDLHAPASQLSVNAARFDVGRLTLQRITMTGSAQGKVRGDRYLSASGHCQRIEQHLC